MMMKAVHEQMRIVSVKTLSACTSPCFTGWETLAMLAAQAAEPSPASLEKSPRLMPFIIVAPSVPPANCSMPNALLMMTEKTCGMRPMFITMTTAANRI